ncbi:uncharacterized protein LOC128014973 [Carassius gibelio]|uniref:uncharacterized protein LOC128014973 n=1 Tax=Carassius gibelio TaxID=101364 RepID=UPI0022781B5C|nr:uncharacterized protein LOC128014973 [Carassius gibelio]
MKVSISAFIALSCIYWKVSGTLVEVVVKPGDNATLHCDCEVVIGQDFHWVKSCSSQIQPPLIISAYKSLLQPIPRYTLFYNDTSESYDLAIENITEADLGLYYCSRVEARKVKKNGIIFEEDVYYTGDTLINLTYVVPSESPSGPGRDCWQCWLILLTAYPTFNILSAILAFVCGYKCCHNSALKESEGHQNGSEMQRQLSQEQEVDTEVCYASLNIPKRGSKRTKSNLLQCSDFSVYNGIKIHT